MFNKRNKNQNSKEIIVDNLTYYKLCILLEEEGYKNFSELIGELLKK